MIRQSRPSHNDHKRKIRKLAFAAVVLACAMVVPQWWCGRDARALFEGDKTHQERLAREVARWLAGGVSAEQFNTGDELFDGEWALVTYQMAALGLGQVALEHPELTAEYRPLIEHCIDRLLAPEQRRFGTSKWREDGLAQLASDHGHAYLGYINLALGMLRYHHPDTRHAGLHDQLTAALERRLDGSTFGIIETYPGEAYPADVAAVVGSIGLHGRATGADHSGPLTRWRTRFERYGRDPTTGWAYQRLDARTGDPGTARGSGTSIAVYFLSFADEALSRDLFLSLRRGGSASLLGFGGMREYPPGSPGGLGDIDSGPVLFGVAVSTTGFTIAGARIHGDPSTFRGLVRTAYLFGLPLERGGRQSFVSGGPLGNAILLAMLTARTLP